ncbi:hypothetical protein HYH02_009823 [Chlamydomonas schloesseri]|uniref:Glycosyl transferase CAP10 domain-containing protein n=1 Tax=Chlamydomonas schloesseri TaxID=2026947 RepID=A0A835W9R3_9CHLO|nr:hypothetical protein HYH02_009823 [Chlamydomonas schloesseri]|eukprot:KAG2442031.1 hypothetical protein HYH02_009823 [Chlamydomonas schloesseri]
MLAHARGERGPRTRPALRMVHALLLMCLSCAKVRAQGAAPADAPVVLTEAPGFHRASDAEMEEAGLYRDNLDADFAPWTNRRYSVRQLYELVATLVKGRPQKYLSLVVIKNNRVGWLPLAARPMALTLSRMKAIASGLRNATRAGLSFPDSLYLMNVWDEGRCVRDEHSAGGALPKTVSGGGSKGGSGGKAKPAKPRSPKTPACTVPLFSLIKSWDYGAADSAETDVLLPFFNHVYENLYVYPWGKKHDKALMRAAMQAQMKPNSTRLWIMKLQETHPDGQRLLDAGITNNLNKKKKVKLANFVTIPDHARWKYLLSADGFTASCRLGKLMGTNSVVLKETTEWIEYYYRSLKAGTHFVPFTKDDVLQVLLELEKDPQRCQRVSAAAQQFAYTYLSQHGKAMYVRRALLKYNGLFDDISDFMSQLVWEPPPDDLAGGSSSSGGGSSGGSSGSGADAAAAAGAGGGGLTLVGLMEQMKAFADDKKAARR